MRHHQYNGSRRSNQGSQAGFPIGFCFLGFLFLLFIFKGAFIWPLFMIFFLFMIIGGASSGSGSYQSQNRADTTSSTKLVSSPYQSETSQSLQEDSKTTTMTRYCSNCGHENDTDANFCYQCGYKIKSV